MGSERGRALKAMRRGPSARDWSADATNRNSYLQGGGWRGPSAVSKGSGSWQPSWEQEDMSSSWSNPHHGKTGGAYSREQQTTHSSWNSRSGGHSTQRPG